MTAIPLADFEQVMGIMRAIPQERGLQTNIMIINMCSQIKNDALLHVVLSSGFHVSRSENDMLYLLYDPCKD